MKSSRPLLLLLVAACDLDVKIQPADPNNTDPTFDPPRLEAPGVTCPTAPQVEMSGTPGVYVSVTDDAPVTATIVTFTLDGATPYRVSPAADGSVYFPIPASQRTIDPSHFYDLRVEATDTDGLTGEVFCRFVGVDTERPEVVILTPAPGEEVWDEALVSARASDGFAAANELVAEVLLDGASIWTGPIDASGIVSWNAGIRSEREYTYEVRVTDPSGNIGSASSTWVQIGGTAIAAPRDGDTYALGESISFEVGSVSLSTVTVASWTATGPSASYLVLQSSLPEALDFETTLSESGEYLIELEWVNGSESGTDSATIQVLEEDDADDDGYRESDGDCDDTDSSLNPGTVWYRDIDNDGYRDASWTDESCTQPPGFLPEAAEIDCDEGDATQNPGAPEVCNGDDDNCDGLIDEGATDADLWYLDEDGDMFGTGASVASCTPPATSSGRYERNDGDCDDADPEIHPGAAESCGSITDRNCDGAVDDEDNDGDGVRACEDCDDNNADANPDELEHCATTFDDDCDGEINEPDADDAFIWFLDADGDHYGTSTSTTFACSEPDGYASAVIEDCDDADRNRNPSFSEYCDGAGVDNNCDGAGDDGAIDAQAWYADDDGDDYGDLDSEAIQCDAPAGFVNVTELRGTNDCDDTSADALPGGVEVCDGLNNDCSDGVDDVNEDPNEPNDTIDLAKDLGSADVWSSMTTTMSGGVIEEGGEDWFVWTATDILDGTSRHGLSVEVSGFGGDVRATLWEVEPSDVADELRSPAAADSSAGAPIVLTTVGDSRTASEYRDGTQWYLQLESLDVDGDGDAYECVETTYTLTISYH